MKKYLKVISICLCVALMVSCISNLSMITKASLNELLENPSFEGYDEENNRFDSWNFFATGDNTRTISKANGKDGENSALITSIDNESMAAIEQQFIVDPNNSYRVSVWLKATEDASGVFDAAGWGEGITLKVYSDDKSLDISSEGIKTVMSWRKVSFVVDSKDIPNNATKLTFSVIMYAVRGCLYIDGASVTEYNGEEDEIQYLYNSGFEDVENGKIYDWNESGRTDIFAPKISNENAFEGNNSLYYNSTDKNEIVNVFQSVNGLKTTERYLFSCYAKALTTAYSYPNAGLRIGIEYTDYLGNIKNLWSKDAFQQAEDWTKINLYFSIPNGAKDVKAYVQSNCVEGTYYIDALNITSIGNFDSLANNSFELFENGEFPYWNWYAGNNDNGENTLNIDSGYEGKAAVISKSFLDNAADIRQTLDFALDNNKDYIVTAYVRATYSDDAPWDMRNWGYAKLMVTDGDKTLESQSLDDIGPWKKLSVIVNKNELSADRYWTVDFVMYGMTGVVYIDNITINEYTGSQESEIYEPLYNLSFEEGKGSAFDYWKTSGTTSTVITETEDFRSGNRAVAFNSVNSGAVNKMYQPLYAFESQTDYVLSIYAKADGDVEKLYDGAGAKLELKYTDENGVEHTKVSVVCLLSDDWNRIALPFSIPENCTNPTVSIVLDCIKGTVVFDDLDICELSVGDVNYDLSFNIKDLVCLKKYMAKISQNFYAPLGDLNLDKAVDTLDLSLLRISLLKGWIENGNLDVWTADSLTRVLKTDSDNGQTEVSLFAAKGEYESFQVVASTDIEERIVVKNITVTDFENESGDVISSSENVTVYREHYVNCLVSSPESNNVLKDNIGEIPDALIPATSPSGEALPETARFKAFPYELETEVCQPYYIDVKIPADTKSGDYTAAYTVYTNKGLKKGNITLRVWDVALSKTQVQGSYFLLKGEVSAQKVEQAAQNRIFINSVDAKQETMLNEKYGYNNANTLFWSGADNKNPVMKDAPDESKVKASINSHNKNLKLFNYTADEIGGHIEELKDKIFSYANVLHKFGIKQLITIPPTEELMDDGTGNPAVDIWTILPKDYDKNIELIVKAREKGCEIWTYNCMAQDSYSPKFLLDYPLINYRIHPGYINYSLGVDGFLYWAIDQYNDLSDPWTSLDVVTNKKVYNGDGILFYPGKDVGLYDTFVPSMRAKAIRDGFEDYELCAAANISVSDVSAIATGFSDWTQDKDVLLCNRIILGNNYKK